MTISPSYDGKRSVLVIVPQWPSGTMALKFGSALMKALGVGKGSAELIQLAPSRIFRVDTDKAEAEVEAALRASGVSWHGSVRLVEGNQPFPMSAQMELDEKVLAREISDNEASGYFRQR